MDINKEREAFEKAMKSRAILDLDYVQYHEISNKYAIQNGLKGEYFKTALDCSHVVNVAWMMWQEKATPEGFVLMPMVPSERMVVAVRHCYEGESYLPYSLYSEFVNQAMIEALEQSHD